MMPSVCESCRDPRGEARRWLQLDALANILTVSVHLILNTKFSALVVDLHRLRSGVSRHSTILSGMLQILVEVLR